MSTEFDARGLYNEIEALAHHAPALARSLFEALEAARESGTLPVREDLAGGVRLAAQAAWEAMSANKYFAPRLGPGPACPTCWGWRKSNKGHSLWRRHHANPIHPQEIQ